MYLTDVLNKLTVIFLQTQGRQGSNLTGSTEALKRVTMAVNDDG